MKNEKNYQKASRTGKPTLAIQLHIGINIHMHAIEIGHNIHGAVKSQHQQEESLCEAANIKLNQIQQVGQLL